MAMSQATRPRGAGGYNVVSGGAKPATAKAKSTGTRNAFGALGWQRKPCFLFFPFEMGYQDLTTEDGYML